MILPLIQIDKQWYLVKNWREDMPEDETLNLRPLTPEENEQLQQDMLDAHYDIWGRMVGADGE